MVNLLLSILQDVELFIWRILRILRCGINFKKTEGWSASVKLEFHGFGGGLYANYDNEEEVYLNLSWGLMEEM